jgi:hypothetical protein
VKGRVKVRGPELKLWGDEVTARVRFVRFGVEDKSEGWGQG